MWHSEKMLLMRLFIAVLVLILTLQSLTKADDIKDFEIQGLSLGDSLLKIFSIEEIEKFMQNENQTNFYPKSKKYFTLSTPSKDKNFRQVNIDLKYLDKSYTTYGISQYKRMQVDECIQEKDIAASQISSLFSQNIEEQKYSKKHRADKTGNTTVYNTDFIFKDGSYISLVCTDWGPEMEKNGYQDNLDVSVLDGIYVEWIINEAY